MIKLKCKTQTFRRSLNISTDNLIIKYYLGQIIKLSIFEQLKGLRLESWANETGFKHFKINVFLGDLSDVNQRFNALEIMEPIV